MHGPLYLLYLDRYHLDDPLFLRGIAMRLTAGKAGSFPCLIVHGSGEEAERLLEAEGVVPRRVDGALAVEGDPGHALVERAVRSVNKQVVATLTEFAVAAVSVQGTDRGLLAIDEEGVLRLGRSAWLLDVVGQRVVPVVSALAINPARKVVEAGAAAVLRSLADRFTGTRPVRVGIFQTGAGKRPDGPITPYALSERGLYEEIPLVHSLLEAKIAVSLLRTADLTDPTGAASVRMPRTQRAAR